MSLVFYSLTTGLDDLYKTIPDWGYGVVYNVLGNSFHGSDYS